jgi:response regulator RpfG family c-di-GMP phosphodiesterase
MSNTGKQKILVADDSEMNRLLLTEMIEDKFDVVEVENGMQAVETLQKHGEEIDLILLDIMMPVMDGFEVLTVMNRYDWIRSIPVIMISSETAPTSIRRAYDLGATDFISRPFDASIVLRRIQNTIMLYDKQKRLVNMVTEQIYEKERNNQLMISILSHIVEFRNGESGLHVLHIQTITELILKELLRRTDKYSMTKDDVALITTASALHDIGKISIPDEVLNKPGKLTDEEYAKMKEHSMIGAEMLAHLPAQDEPIVKQAYEICRWHHERYDGRGYPDGLKGEEIPIAAQIVSLADVYDALTSARVYKPPFSPEKAIDMITHGECGAFNPLLLECLVAIAPQIEEEVNSSTYGTSTAIEAELIMERLMNQEGQLVADHTLQMLEYERGKNRFFTEHTGELMFEYSYAASTLRVSAAAGKLLGVEAGTSILDPKENEKLRESPAYNAVVAAVKKTTPENMEFTCDITVDEEGEEKKYHYICHTIWSSEDTPKRMIVMGKIIID